MEGKPGKTLSPANPKDYDCMAGHPMSGLVSDNVRGSASEWPEDQQLYRETFTN